MREAGKGSGRHTRWELAASEEPDEDLGLWRTAAAAAAVAQSSARRRARERPGEKESARGGGGGGGGTTAIAVRPRGSAAVRAFLVRHGPFLFQTTILLQFFFVSFFLLLHFFIFFLICAYSFRGKLPLTFKKYG